MAVPRLSSRLTRPHAIVLLVGLVDALPVDMVLDVVEGTALEALPHMKQLVESRPSSFPRMEAALAWAVDSGLARDLASAQKSLPSQLVCTEAGDCVWRTNVSGFV